MTGHPAQLGRHLDWGAAAWLAALCMLAGAVGVAAGVSEEAGLVALSLAALPAMLHVRPIYWIAGALIAGMTLRAFSTAGVLPGIAPFLHYPAVFGGLAIAWARGSRTGPGFIPLLGGAAVVLVAVISTVLNELEPGRLGLMMALLAEPFAAAAAIALCRPSSEELRTLRRVVIGVVAIQIPIVLAQLAGIDALTDTNRARPDQIQGFLAGSDVGHHELGAIGIVVGIWLLTLARRGRPARLLGGASMMLLAPFTGTKQAVAAAPAALAGAGLLIRRTSVGRAFLAAAIGVAAIAIPVILAGYAGNQVDRLLAGEGGKIEGIERLVDDATADPGIGLFGSGPASSVSASAFLTAETETDPGSPIGRLNLEPAEKSIELGALESVSGSFDSARSSLIGVFGDLGVLGLGAYVLTWLAIALVAIRSRSPDAAGLIAALIVFAQLGIIGGSWEDPPLPLIVGALAGIALASGQRRPTAEDPV